MCSRRLPLAPDAQRSLAACLAVFVICALARPASALDFSADAAVGSDDNIVAARDGTPRLTEQFLQLGAAVSHSELLAPGLALRGQVRVDGRAHARYEGLNELAGALDGTLLLRPGQRFGTPTFGATLGIGASQFQSELRDALEVRARLFARSALTTRVSARASLFAATRGSDSEVFDTDVRGLGTHLDWQATRAVILSIGYEYRDGDVVSLRTPSAQGLSFFDAVQVDDAFAGLEALRFRAQTHIGSIGAQYALTPRLVLDTQVKLIESDSDFGTRYRRFTTVTGLLLRF